MPAFERMDLAEIVRQGARELSDAALSNKRPEWVLDKKRVEVTGVPTGVTNTDGCDGWLFEGDQPRLYLTSDAGEMGALLKAAA